MFSLLNQTQQQTLWKVLGTSNLAVPISPLHPLPRTHYAKALLILDALQMTALVTALSGLTPEECVVLVEVRAEWHGLRCVPSSCFVMAYLSNSLRCQSVSLLPGTGPESFLRVRKWGAALGASVPRQVTRCVSPPTGSHWLCSTCPRALRGAVHLQRCVFRLP